MYPNCFHCPIYRQFYENYYFRSPAPYGPPIGTPFGPPAEGPFGPPTGGSYSPPSGSPFFPSETPPGGMTAPQNVPTAPPPASAPTKAQGTKLFQSQGGATTLVSSGSLYPCLFRPTYLWLSNGRELWVYLTYLDNTTASGYYWTGFNWAYFGIDVRNIDSFYCNP